ncbi:TlpA disulfide reductase family protein [Magnetococcus sp. PR-3]|uniref:TlpA disulfide reductase family protein n=1 Tax=Magnetococcus sp. PR-3 TaxID=3120355 RepID=UPI002FCE14A6
MRRNLLLTFFVLGLISIAVYVLVKQVPPPSSEQTQARGQGAIPSAPKTGHWSDIALTTLAGHSVKLADFKGKVILVNYWATWCPPCLAEIPDLIQAQNDFGPKGFQVVGIDYQDRADLETLKRFVKRKRINYPIIRDTPKKTHTISKAMGGVFALPMSLLIDRDGKIIKTHTGQLHYKDLEGWLKKQL